MVGVLSSMSSALQSAAGVCRMKKDTHPEYHEEAKVGADGSSAAV